jgi:hypothetical protein
LHREPDFEKIDDISFARQVELRLHLLEMSQNEICSATIQAEP